MSAIRGWTAAFSCMLRRVRRLLPALPLVAFVVACNGKATRVGFRIENGEKVRFAKTTGEAI